MRNLMLGVRFLCELGMLAALAVWGFQATDNPVLKVILGIGAPVVAAVVWGTFLAPRRRVSLPFGTRAAIEMVVFGVATLALWGADQPIVAIIFAVVAVAQRIVLGNGDRLEESLP